MLKREELTTEQIEQIVADARKAGYDFFLTAEERGQHTSRAVLYAFDAESGDELFSSKDAIDDWTHLSTITVVDGSVYVTTRQSFVYAFGLKK